MPEPHAVVLFAAAALALLVIPGPSVLYIVTRSITQGRAAGFASVAGVHAGTLVHVAAAAFGLSAVLVRSATLYTAVRWAGAAYLILLGIRRLATRAAPSDEARVEREPLRKLFRDGIVVNTLNPKTALFFFAFLPQFVDPARGNVTVQVLFFGLLFIALGMVSDGTYALLASAVGASLERSRTYATAERWFSGTVFVTLGVTAALAGSKPTTAD